MPRSCRLDLQALFVLRGRFVQLPQLLERHRQVVVGVGIHGVEFDRLLPTGTASACSFFRAKAVGRL